MMVKEYIKLQAKLAVARDIAEDFRENTSLRTIIKEYEARIKELDKQREKNGY